MSLLNELIGKNIVIVIRASEENKFWITGDLIETDSVFLKIVNVEYKTRGDYSFGKLAFRSQNLDFALVPLFNVVAIYPSQNLSKTEKSIKDIIE